MAKPKTTDDSLQAASTADTFFPTNPGEGLALSGGEMARVSEEEERPLNSARLGELREEAEMRAEHQAQARVTMLNLARALEESHARQRELQKQLLRERESLLPLRNRIQTLEQDLDKALLEEEKRKAEELLERGFKSGNKLFLAMMLEKSREAYRSDHFTVPEDAEEDEEGGPSEGGPAEGESPTDQSSLSRRRTRSKELVNKIAGQVRIVSDGDRVTFTWILKLWYREVQQNKDRVAQQDADRAKHLWEEEQRRRMQEEVEARVKDMHRQMESMGKQLDVANDAIEQYKKRIRSLEKQVEKAYLDAAEREEQLQGTIAQLKNQLEEALRKLLEREAEIQRLKDEIQAQNSKYSKAQADFETERRQLQDAIRKITTELHEATILAKYMRETMLKSKRDAAASVSPQKFAELIAQLESMRDQLNGLNRDYSTLKHDNADLHQKLDKNRRRLELERQFLPLIRHARGPLGPKTGVNSITLGAPAPEQGSPEMPKKLHRSHSAVSHSGTKGYNLDATVGAPGGS
mmetsp:Transcript_41312/g.119542  ORF Transcript_41312/g.119542 Transcript_41312/m.119542 type:complete len:522 (-) Transcript_41312:348-1913(-)